MEPSLPERSDGHEEPQEERKLSIALLLAGVCRKWRAVALSLPQIWADVHIFLHRQIGDKALAILRDIVARSNDLTIRLYSESVSGDKTRNRALQLALAVLQKESARWRSLQMCMPYQLIKDLFEPNMDLSRIESLYIHSNEDECPISLLPLWKTKHLRPQHLSLDAPMPPLDIDMPLDRLTHVVAYRFNNDQVMKIVRSAPLLTSIDILDADEETRTSFGLHADYLVHENLRHITYKAKCYSAYDAEEVNTLFSESVEYPRLTRVDYDVMLRTRRDQCFDTLDRDCPPLQEL
ncbi:hypothetical protein CPC08DRAFT_479754 [Agrocybe pediades]|nr:hypothetical protein CPC08DRAFT_479754 [Agrocybe pediades]